MLGLVPHYIIPKGRALGSFIFSIYTIIRPRPKVQMLANYLGVTTSDLLGEANKKPAAENGDGVSENEAIFRALPPDLQEEALRYMRYLAAQAGTHEDPKD